MQKAFQHDTLSTCIVKDLNDKIGPLNDPEGTIFAMEADPNDTLWDSTNDTSKDEFEDEDDSKKEKE